MLTFKEYMGLFGLSTVGNDYNSEQYNINGATSKIVSPEGKSKKHFFDPDKLFLGKKQKNCINKEKEF